MEHIDVFYFINLDRRTDRLKEIVGELEKMEIPKEKIIRVQGFEHKVGIVGCVKSHIQAINHFIESGKNICMIMEDDFEFTETKEKVNEVLKKIFTCGTEIDCLMLAGNSNMVLEMDTAETIAQRIFFATTTAGYILSKKYAPALLHNFLEGLAKQEKWITAFGEPENAFNLDLYWIYEQVSRKFYFTVPKLGRQRDSPSDITPTSSATIVSLNVNA
jgi:GR25 family glycosyltransferase involved in LPS biosynthesis